MNQIEDAVFGKLIWEKEYGWWSGELKFSPESIAKIRINAENETDTDAISAAHRLFEKIRVSDSEIRNFAADELLELHNESWREDDEAEISREDFCSRIKITSVNFEGEGDITIYFDDDDLFWGHVIVVQINENFEFTYADIAG